MSFQFKDTPAACQYPSRDIVAELSPPSLLKPVQLLCLKPHNMTSDYVYIHNYIYIVIIISLYPKWRKILQNYSDASDMQN